MSLHLPALYHWAPRSRRESIQRSGLVPGSEPTINTGRFCHDGRAMLCFCADAVTAWEYSAGTVDAQHGWDLWQATIADDDEVHVIPFWGRELIEIRVANTIPPSRLAHVASKVGESDD